MRLSVLIVIILERGDVNLSNKIFYYYELFLLNYFFLFKILLEFKRDFDTFSISFIIIHM